MVALHVMLIVVTSYTAFALRFDGSIPAAYFHVWLNALPLLIVVRTVVFVPLKLYEGLWRYAGIWDLRNIIVGVTASSGLFYPLALWRLAGPSYPRSILVTDAVLLILSMGGTRFGRRLYHELSRAISSRRVLIVGAGDAGERVVRDMIGSGSGDRLRR